MNPYVIAALSFSLSARTGNIIATLDVCGETHASSYKYIFLITVLITLKAAVILVILASLGFTY